MNKSSISLTILTLALGLFACEGSKIRKKEIELDPVVAAEVKRINMERYGGTWLDADDKGSLYIELNEAGYYVLLEDADGRALRSDVGDVDHYKPGLMILKTHRPECEADGIVYLKMDQRDGAVRLLSTKDKNYSAALVAATPRERLRSESLNCMLYE